MKFRIVSLCHTEWFQTTAVMCYPYYYWELIQKLSCLLSHHKILIIYYALLAEEPAKAGNHTNKEDKHEIGSVESMVVLYHNRMRCSGHLMKASCGHKGRHPPESKFNPKFGLPEYFSDHTSEAMNNVSSTTASPMKNERNTPEPVWPA